MFSKGYPTVTSKSHGNFAYRPLHKLVVWP